MAEAFANWANSLRLMRCCQQAIRLTANATSASGMGESPLSVLANAPVKTGFTSINLCDYVELHLRANPGTKRVELTQQLESAINAHRSGVRCQCGAPIWIIGSSQTGLGCFACITGQAVPDRDYEIALADEVTTT